MSTHAIDDAIDDAAAGRDGDLLDWLGFAPGEPEDGPLVVWPAPAVRPTLRRTSRGRHRALRPSAA